MGLSSVTVPFLVAFFTSLSAISSLLCLCVRAATSEIRQFLSVLADGQGRGSQLAVSLGFWSLPLQGHLVSTWSLIGLILKRGGGGGGGLGRSFTVLQAIRMAYSSAVKMLVPVGSV